MLALGLGLIALLIAVDQISKAIIVHSMALGEEVVFIKGLLSIYSHRNTGAAWGMFSRYPGLLIVVTFAAIGLLGYMMKDFNLKTNRWYSISMILLMAGALGNLIDRLFRHQVIDFLKFDFIDFPIFNFADTLLTVGVIVFLIDFIFIKKA
jgi:signal peptidase II